jgi:hypothetical protein
MWVMLGRVSESQAPNVDNFEKILIREAKVEMSL